MECFLCQKHAGKVTSPPGGYIYEDPHWMVCHAPVEKGPLGTLFIESKRHFLDFAEMNQDEAASYGTLLKNLYIALRSVLEPERIYQVTMLEGVPHFHTWLVPRSQNIKESGIPFLVKDYTCTDSDAQELAASLRQVLKDRYSI